MLPLRRFPFAPWVPDQASYPGSGGLEAKNAIPQLKSYRDWRAFETISSPPPTTNEPLLAAVWTEVGGVTELIAGTATRLLRYQGGSWLVVGSGYSVTGWEFVAFGDEVYAVAPGVDPQVIDLSVASPSFAAAPGSPDAPPRARRAAVVLDFLVFGDLDSEARLIQWSGYNNAGIWDAGGDTMTQASSQFLFEGGDVQKIVGGPTGYIFQERAVKMMTYLGPPVTFSILDITRQRGTLAPDSVVPVGDRVFFYGTDGFHSLQGSTFQPIGAERVDRWFIDNVAAGEVATMRGAADRANSLVFWAFKTTPSATTFDLALVYNYDTDAWSYVELGVANIFELKTLGYTLEQLDAITGGDIDTNSFNLDSAAYIGGALALFGSSANGEMGAFSGAPRVAELDTVEFDGGENRRYRLTEARPIVIGDTGTSLELQVGHRSLLTQPLTWTPARGTNAVGEVPVLSDNRYNRLRVRVAGGFEHAVGVDAIGRSSGRF